ncbi:MAG TPA: hypothetical protein VLI69_02580, partial [Gammaproteobacteria bacterium]|nr:hypothetical protein [Gammaproteobacteria bacterium]
MESNRTLEDKKPDNEDLSFLTDQELQTIVRISYEDLFTKLPTSMVNACCRHHENKLLECLKQIFKNPINDLINYIYSPGNLTEEEIKEFRQLNTPSALLNIIRNKKTLNQKISEKIHTDDPETQSFLNAIQNVHDDNYRWSIKYIKFLLNLSFKCQNKSKTEILEFTDEYAPDRQLHIMRMLEGNPDCYLKQGDEELKKNQKRKIIIHWPYAERFHRKRSFLDEIRTVIGPSNLFNLYICQNGVITPIMDKRHHIKTDDISTESVIKILNDAHENVDDYYIFDILEFENSVLSVGDISTSLENIDHIPLVNNIKKITINFNQSDEEQIKNLSSTLKDLNKLKELTVKFQSNKDSSEFIFPQASEHLGSIHLEHKANQSPININLDQAKNLAEIKLIDIRSNFLDLTKLEKLSYVTLSGRTIISDIKITPEQARTVTFDFLDHELHIKSIFENIFILKKKGARVKLSETQRKELTKILADENNKEKLSELEKKLETEKKSEETEAKKTIKLRYNPLPSPMQESTSDDFYQNDSLLNEKGPIDASRYRYKILNNITLQNDQLFFTPYLLNVEKSDFVDLSQINKKKSNEFNQQVVQELNKQ